MNIKLFQTPPFTWHNYLTHLRHYGIALLIFLIGVLISIFAFKFYRNQDISRTKAEFDRLADMRIFLIKNILEETVGQLEYIQRFYYASPNFSKKDFHIFVSNPLSLYPNLLFLGWLDTTHPQTLPLTYSPGLNFIDLNPTPEKHNQFFPLTYLESKYSINSLSFDHHSYPSFINLLQHSWNLPTVVLSNEIDYFQEGRKQGFFLCNSIFQEENQEDVKRTDRLLGIIIGFSNFEDIIQDARLIAKPIGINISIYDVSAGKEHLIYWSAATVLKDPFDLSSINQNIEEQWSRSHLFTLGDRLWKLKATPTLKFIQQHQQEYWTHWEVPIIGILISGLTAFYFLILINRHILVEEEVQRRTEELANTNRILQQEIHERQRIEEGVIKKQRYLQKRHEALEYLTKFTTSELRQAINEVILRTASVMQIDRVSVWFYEVENHVDILSCAGLYVFSSNSFSNHLELTSTYFPHYFQALAKHTHLMIPSPHYPEINQELASYLAVFHIISKLDIPIISEDQLLGVLCCEETRYHREWPLEDRHFGQSIADIVAIMIEQSARHKVEKALQENEERLRFLTQKAIDGIISINDKGEIVSWNYGAERMFGYKENDVLGKSLDLIIPQKNLYKGEGLAKPIELKAKHHDDHMFPVEVSYTQGKVGDASFDTIIVRDITERKENEKRLLKAIREAQAANEAKNEFLATISHELRTPLNAIIGFDQCILMGMDGPINEQQQISLKKIEKSSIHLLSLINDILDLAKVEANKMELEITSQNIVKTIHSCIEEVQPLIKQKHLEIHTSITTPFISMEFDKMRIRQVLINLLSNAIKFTQKGSITIFLKDEVDKVEIRITDTGIGLSPEEISKIFRPFAQADSSITRKYGGTGLGLVISKKIIDLHGGTIHVESQKGQGSTFVVILPKTQ